MFGGLDDYSMDSAEQCGESRFCWYNRSISRDHRSKGETFPSEVMPLNRLRKRNERERRESLAKRSGRSRGAAPKFGEFRPSMNI